MPAPSHVVAALAKGEPVDHDTLMAWWEGECPSHLRHLRPDLAAVLSDLLPGDVLAITRDFRP